MPRSGSGTYTLPSGNPVVTGTTIESNWANTTLSDIATTLTDSLSRSGQGGMTAALRVADGTQGAPGVGFANETSSGFYRAGTGEVWAVVQGAQTLNLDASGVYVPADKTTTVDGAFVFNEAGADKDARFEGDTDANLLFVDASTDRVGIGSNTPSYKLDVNGSVAIGSDARVNGNVVGTGATTTVYNASGDVYVRGGTGSKLSLGANNTNDLAVLDSSGNLGIGTSSPGAKLEVNDGNAQVRNSATQTQGTVLSYGLTFRSTNQVGQDRGVIAAIKPYFGSASDNDFGIAFQTQTTTAGGVTTKAILDPSGNLGLGVTPSAWNSSIKAFDFGSTGALYAVTDAVFAHNAYVNTSGNWTYKTTAAAGYYQQFAGTHKWYTAPSGTAGNAITFTQAMTLDASGNLGVGTTSPSTYGTFVVLNTTSRYTAVQSTGLPLIRYDDNSANDVVLQNSGINGANHGIGIRAELGDSVANTASAGYMRWITEGAWSSSSASRDSALTFATTLDGVAGERARITSVGDLLVGTTTSQDPLTVNGGATLNGGLDFSVSGTKNWQVVGNATDFYIGDQTLTRYAQLQGITTFTAWTFVSDRRLKHQIKDLHYGLDALMQIRPREFNFIKDDQFSIGFIAQELKEVIPEAVTGNEIEFADNDSPEERASKTMGISKEMLIPVLVKAIQEQQALITDLRARVAALEAQP